MYDQTFLNAIDGRSPISIEDLAKAYVIMFNKSPYGKTIWEVQPNAVIWTHLSEGFLRWILYLVSYWWLRAHILGRPEAVRVYPDGRPPSLKRTAEL